MSTPTATTQTPQQRLEYLRGELRAERISYDELSELQSLAGYIDAGDVELLEAAGVPEHDAPRDEEQGERWRVDDGCKPNRGRVFVIDEGKRLSVAVLYGTFEQREPVSVEEAQTRAARIVRAVNSHDALVGALKGVAIMLNTELEKYQGEPWAQRVRAALATNDD